MKDTDKKIFEKTYNRVEEDMNELSKLPKNLQHKLILERRLDLIFDLLNSIKQALLMKGIITEEDLERGLKAHKKQEEEAKEFYNKLNRGQ